MNIKRDLVRSALQYCDSCDKTFTSSYGWKQHMQKHTVQWAFCVTSVKKDFLLNVITRRTEQNMKEELFHATCATKDLKVNEMQMHYVLHKQHGIV